MSVIPKTSFGNTFTVPFGNTNSTSAVTFLGDIDYDTINRSRFSEQVEFSKFYKSITDSIMSRLGSPVIRVELTDHQILTAIDEAISKLDFHAPNWCTNYMTFKTEPGESIYELPSVVMNNMQYVIYKKSLLAVQAAQGSLEFDFFIKYFQDNFLMRDFAISDFLLMTMHLEQIRKILSRDGSWDVVDNKYLLLHPTPQRGEEVIVQFRALNSGTLHPYFVNWVQRFSTAIAKVILGGIRGKYSTLPSPGGGAQLNGQALVEEGNAEQQRFIEELFTEIEEPPAFTTF